MVLLVYPSQDTKCGSAGEIGCFAPWLPGHTHVISELAVDFVVALCSKSWPRQSLASTVCALQEAWSSSGMSNTRSFIFGWICVACWGADRTRAENIVYLYLHTSLPKPRAFSKFSQCLQTLVVLSSGDPCFASAVFAPNETEHKTVNGAECFGPHIEQEPLLIMWCIRNTETSRLLACAFITN